MIGQVVYGRGKSRKERIRGALFYTVYLPRQGWLSPCRRARRWRELRKNGVRFALFPPELREEAARFGVRPVSVAPLRRALMDQLVGRGGCVRLAAHRVDGDVQRAALLLSRRYRHVVLDVGPGQEDLSRLLYRRFGVAGGSGKDWEMTVTFRDEAEKGRAIYLGEGCAAYQRITYRLADEQADEPDEAWLGALFLAGSLKKDELCVKSVDFNA